MTRIQERRRALIERYNSSPNLINVDVNESRPSNSGEKRTFTPGTWVRGIAYNNSYWGGGNPITRYSSTSFRTKITDGYTSAFPLLLDKNATYMLSADAKDFTGDRGYASGPPTSGWLVASYYKSDGSWITYSDRPSYPDNLIFTVPSDAYYTLIFFRAKDHNSTTFYNIKLVKLP